MKQEDAEKIRCDRCKVVFGLYRHKNGWRCPSCIWNERESLIEQAKNLLNNAKNTTSLKKLSKSMDCLKEAVEAATS